MMTTKKEVMLSFKERELVLATQDGNDVIQSMLSCCRKGDFFLIRKLEIKTGTRMHIGMWVGLGVRFFGSVRFGSSVPV
jgi:hypothetical protein